MATLGVRMANSSSGQLHSDGADHGLTWTDAADGTRSQWRHLHDQPLSADRSRSPLKNHGGTCFCTSRTRGSASLRLRTLLDWRGDAIAPLRPGTIVIPNVI